MRSPRNASPWWGDIDEQGGAVLFEQLTGHRPVTITNTLGHEVTTSFTVGEHTPPSVNLRWSGRQKWGFVASRRRP